MRYIHETQKLEDADKNGDIHDSVRKPFRVYFPMKRTNFANITPSIGIALRLKNRQAENNFFVVCLT